MWDKSVTAPNPAGQRAAARALLKPEGEQGKRSDLTSDQLNRSDDVSGTSLKRARFVLRHDKSLLLSVIHGSVTLNAAYEQAKESADEQDEKDAAQAEERAKLDSLRRRYPDLARRVEEDGLSLAAMLVEAASLAS